MKTKTTKINLHNCPVCYHKLNHMTGADNRTPSPGDYSICAYCGAFLVMDEDIQSVAMNDDQIEILRLLSPETWEELNRIKIGLRDHFQPNAGMA